MKRKILLVDGYNMIAFWQETRQLFQKSELDAARNILLQKLSHYASFEAVSYTHLVGLVKEVVGMVQID